MSRALATLLWRSVQGRFRRWLRLLKQPKYLVGTLFGAVYLVAVFNPWLRSGPGSMRLPVYEVLEQLDAGRHLVLALLAAMGFTLLWVFQPSKPRLRLDEAEIHTLLPAPLSRRQILQFALCKGYLRVLLSAVILTLLSGWRSWWLLPAYVLVLGLVDLHMKGCSFAKARWKELPVATAWLWRGAVIGALAVFWTLLGGALWPLFQPVREALVQADDPATLGAAAVTMVQAAVEQPLVTTLLTPFRWVTAPLMAVQGGASLTLWLWPILLVVLHHEWVVRSEARFEEAVLHRARRRLRGGHTHRRALPSTRRRRQAPFQLAAAGLPEVAVVWKNLLWITRRPLRLWAVAALVLLGVFAAVPLSGRGMVVLSGVTGVLAALGCIGMPMLAGLIFRYDLRSDLEQVEMVRTWPLPSWRLVLAEIAAPVLLTVTLAAFSLGLLAATWLGGKLAVAWGRLPVHELALADVSLLTLVLVAGAVLLLASAVTGLSVTIQNLVVLWLPSWLPLGLRPRQRGVAATGQWLLVGLLHAVAMGLASILPGLLILLTVGVHLLLGAEPQWWELPVGAVVLAVVLWLEVVLLALLGGRLWQGMDPSRELLAGG